LGTEWFIFSLVSDTGNKKTPVSNDNSGKVKDNHDSSDDEFGFYALAKIQSGKLNNLKLFFKEGVSLFSLYFVPST
jgi:hypothetical protein